MAVLRDHIPYYLDILCMDEFLRDPVLVFGSQDCYCEKKRTLKKFIKQRAKLKVSITSHTGIGRASFKVFTRKIFNNVFVNILCEV